MIHQKTRKRNTKTPKHPPAGEPAKFADMRRFLQINPLPGEMRHLEPYIKKLPLRAFFDLVFNSAEFGFDDDKIEKGIIGLAEFSEAPAYRCACCMRWTPRETKEFYPFTSIVVDHYEFFTVCSKCHDLIVAGRSTPAMERNLRAYTGIAALYRDGEG